MREWFVRVVTLKSLGAGKTFRRQGCGEWPWPLTVGTAVPSQTFNRGHLPRAPHPHLRKGIPLAPLDLLLGVIVIVYAIIGYRQGLIASLSAAAGFVFGTVLALWLLPRALARTPQLATYETLTVGVTVLVLVLFAISGQTLGALLGRHVRPRGGGRIVDAALGAVASVVVAGLLAWLAAGLLRPIAPAPLARAVGESQALTAVDDIVPGSAAQVLDGLHSAIDRSGFPRAFDGLRAEPIAPALPPDPAVANTPGLQSARGSIVKVSGSAQACRQGQEGTGWVVRPGQVVTNAHVVAGVRDVDVQVGGTGATYSGRVVLFDPATDLAVVRVPALSAPALPEGEPLSQQDAAVVAGFPLSGPYHEESARVRGQLTAIGSDIYGSPGTSRDIYSLYTRVEPGNSGGPLLDPNGRVVGVIFAKSLDNDQTGYALTLDEVRDELNEAAGATSPVTTGACQR